MNIKINQHINLIINLIRISQNINLISFSDNKTITHISLIKILNRYMSSLMTHLITKT